MTWSALPCINGSTMAGASDGKYVPSPSIIRTYLSSIAPKASCTACPLPFPDWIIILAPASLAIVTVSSLLLPSITRILLNPSSLKSAMSSPMVAPSFRVGISTQTSSYIMCSSIHHLFHSSLVFTCHFLDT